MVSRSWMVTINVTDERIWTKENIKTDDKDFRFITGQMELAPTTGQEHWQLFLQLKSPQRMSKVKKILDCEWAHCEPKVANSTVEQCVAYCTKEETRKPDTERILIGECCHSSGSRTDLVELRNSLKRGASEIEILESHPEEFFKYSRGIERARQIYMREASLESRPDLRVTVLWGDPGSGKTRYVYDHFGFKDVFTLTQDKDLWWDGYTGQSVVMLDDFYGWIMWGELLTILDIYPHRVKIKGGFSYLNCKHIYITSNRPWYKWYEEKDGRNFTALSRRIHMIYRFKDGEVIEESTDVRHDGQFAVGFNTV